MKRGGGSQSQDSKRQTHREKEDLFWGFSTDKPPKRFTLPSNPGYGIKNRNQTEIELNPTTTI